MILNALHICGWLNASTQRVSVVYVRRTNAHVPFSLKILFIDR